jgi:hypothetical protein
MEQLLRNWKFEEEECNVAEVVLPKQKWYCSSRSGTAQAASFYMPSIHAKVQWPRVDRLLGLIVSTHGFIVPWPVLPGTLMVDWRNKFELIIYLANACRL